MMPGAQKFSYWMLLISFAVFGWATNARDNELAQNISALANSVSATQNQISELRNEMGEGQ